MDDIGPVTKPVNKCVKTRQLGVRLEDPGISKSRGFSERRRYMLKQLENIRSPRPGYT